VCVCLREKTPIIVIVIIISILNREREKKAAETAINLFVLLLITHPNNSNTTKLRSLPEKWLRLTDKRNHRIGDELNYRPIMKTTTPNKQRQTTKL